MKEKILWLLKKTILHLLFWLIVYFFFYSFFSIGSANINFLLYFSITLSVIAISGSYVIGYKLIPEFLILEKYWKFSLYVAYLIIFIIFSVLVTVLFGFMFFFNLEYKHMPDLTKNTYVIFVCVILIIVLFTSFKILKHNYKSNEEKKNIENKFLATQLQLKEQELKFLKMQIHPHFLFNTLNTLYGFALKKSDEAPDMILKLSNLLDYILYQVEKPLVFLNDEVNHIDDYISLEKMRFQDSLLVNFDKEIHQENIQIAPMLLLPFVENSFKHGAQIDGILKVDIKLKTTHDSLFFEIKNSTKNNAASKKGIGLENIKKRLEMLYGKTYHLDISQTKNSFRVELKTPLKND